MATLKLSLALAALFAAQGVSAGGMAYGVDEDLAVAVEKANLLAGKEAQRRGTCMGKSKGFANPNECTKHQDGKNWVCAAEYSHQRGSCRGAATFKEAIDSAIETLDKLCSKGREAACAAVAGG